MAAYFNLQNLFVIIVVIDILVNLSLYPQKEKERIIEASAFVMFLQLQ